MADTKISELTELIGSAFVDADEITVVDTSATETKRMTKIGLFTFLDVFDIVVGSAAQVTNGLATTTLANLLSDVNWGANIKVYFLDGEHEMTAPIVISVSGVQFIPQSINATIDFHSGQSAIAISAIAIGAEVSPDLNPTTHGYSDGDFVYITGIVGSVELNGRTFTIKAGVDTEEIDLYQEDNSTKIASGVTSLEDVTPWDSVGTVQRFFPFKLTGSNCHLRINPKAIIPGVVYDTGSNNHVQYAPDRRVTMAKWHTQNAFGSTNTSGRKYTTEQTAGDAIVGVSINDAVFGWRTIAKMKCICHISVTDVFNAAEWIGVTLNGIQKTTAIQSQAVGTRLALSQTSGADDPENIQASFIMEKHDIVRVETGQGSNGGTVSHAEVVITTEELFG